MRIRRRNDESRSVRRKDFSRPADIGRHDRPFQRHVLLDHGGGRIATHRGEDRHIEGGGDVGDVLAEPKEENPVGEAELIHESAEIPLLRPDPHEHVESPRVALPQQGRRCEQMGLPLVPDEPADAADKPIRVRQPQLLADASRVGPSTELLEIDRGVDDRHTGGVEEPSVDEGAVTVQDGCADDDQHVDRAAVKIAVGGAVGDALRIVPGTDMRQPRPSQPAVRRHNDPGVLRAVTVQDVRPEAPQHSPQLAHVPNE